MNGDRWVVIVGQLWLLYQQWVMIVVGWWSVSFERWAATSGMCVCVLGGNGVAEGDDNKWVSMG